MKVETALAELTKNGFEIEQIEADKKAAALAASSTPMPQIPTTIPQLPTSMPTTMPTSMPTLP